MPPPPGGTYPGQQPPYPPAGPYAGRAQPGYPGGPGPYPGAGWTGAATSPAPRRRGRAAGIVAAIVAAAVAAAATGIVLLTGRSDSPATMALKAGRAVAPATGITFVGTIAGEDANVTVTRAGTVEGTYTQGGHQLSRITIGGVTYLKAPAAFWTSDAVPPAQAGQAGGRWAKAPSDAVEIGFGSLTPAQISQVLEHVGKRPAIARAKFGGRQVVVLSAGGTRYFITTNAPHRLVHVEGFVGARPYSFDVTPLTATTVHPVFTILRGDVRALQGAADPQALVLPARKIRFDDCTTAAVCTVSGELTVSDADSPTVLLKMTVAFSATRGGTPFATCTDTVSATPLSTVSPQCGLRGPVWSRWFASHTSVWAHADYEATVNSASDVATLQSELDAEQQAG